MDDLAQLRLSRSFTERMVALGLIHADDAGPRLEYLSMRIARLEIGETDLGEFDNRAHDWLRSG